MSAPDAENQRPTFHQSENNSIIRKPMAVSVLTGRPPGSYRDRASVVMFAQ